MLTARSPNNGTSPTPKPLQTPAPLRAVRPKLPSASDSSGPIAVAAAIAINVISSQSLASIAAGVTVVSRWGRYRSVVRQYRWHCRGRWIFGNRGWLAFRFGVAVAINLTNVTNTAVVVGAVNAQGLTVNAGMTDVAADEEHTTTATAKSGASGGNASIAVSLGLNIANITTTASIDAAATVDVTGVGNVAVNATSNGASTATAIPNDPGPTPPPNSGSLGIGASVALNIVNDRANATLLAANFAAAGAVAVTAAGGHAATTNAEAGAGSAGLSLAPAVAITVSTVQRVATVTGPSTILVGSLTVSAIVPGTANSVATTASGSATSSGSAAAGIALSLNIIDHDVTATLARNVTATGGVSVEAFGQSKSTSTATAAASGAPDDGEQGAPNDPSNTDPDAPENVDDQIAAERGLANSQSMANGGDGTTDSAGTPSATTSSGTIKVAAAIAINITNTASVASIAVGFTVTADGLVSVKSSANTEGVAIGDGSAADGSDIPAGGGGTSPSVGIAVAINLANVDNTATIDGSVTAGDIEVSAAMTDVGSDVVHTFGATAASGASGAGVTIAVSFALSIANVTTVADISATATITLTSSDVTIETVSNGESTVEAKPNDPSAPGGSGSFGLGASVALNIVNDTARASLTTASISGAENVSILAGGGHAMTTTSTAGAGSAGLSLAPSIAIAISNVTRSALVEAAAGALTISGALIIRATAPVDGMTTTTTATGSATSVGGSAAVGISLALTLVTHTVTATTNRDVVAGGNVTLEAFGRSVSASTAVASAAGAPGSDQPGAPDEGAATGNVNSQIADERDAANTQATDNGGADSSGSGTTPSAESSGAPITVAAAIAVNIAATTATASIPTGVTVSSGGIVTLGATANTEAVADANGGSNTEGGSAAVGIAVAINLATITTTAAVDGAVIAQGLVITVGMTDAGGDTDHAFGANAVSGSSGGGIGIAVSLALNIVNLDHTAALNGSATVTTGGDVAITADSLAVSTVSATPSAAVVAGKFGVGASVALNLVTDQAIATIDAAATVDFAAANNVTLLASGGHSMMTTAEAGAGSTGVSLAPAIAVAISNVDRVAIIDGAASPVLSLTGSLTITSRGPPTEMVTTTTATGSTESTGSAAVGIALALTLATHTTTATTTRSITAGGDVSIEAFGQSGSSSAATASAAGAPGSGEAGAPDEGGASGDVNSQIAAERDAANNQAAASGGEGSAGAGDTPSAETSQGPITVAAAIAINIANSTSLASIPGPVTVTAGGRISVKSSADTDAGAAADGSSNTEGGSAAVGVAVAINLANIDNMAKVEGTVDAGNGLTIDAAMSETAVNGTFGDGNHTLGATAVSGSSGGNIGIAVSLALNIANVDTLGELSGTGTATVTGGTIDIGAASKASSSVAATPNDPVSGGSLGIGASVALNIVNDEAIAQVADGATFNVTTNDAASIIASGGHSVTTNAEAGAGSTGISLVPAIAITISNVDRIARIDGDAGDPAVSLGGALTIQATAAESENEAITTAKGAAESSGSAAVGIALALNIVNHNTLATTERSVTAPGDVTIEANGRTASAATAIASAGGQDPDDTDADTTDDDVDNPGPSDVNGLLTQERNQADNQAEANGDAESGSGATVTPEAETSSGPITVAGAVAVNLATTVSSATIPVGVTVTSGGKVSVMSSANTDAAANGDGSATNGGSAGVGIAVAIDLANVTNTASIAGTVVADTGLMAVAGMTESGLDDVWHWNGTSWDRIDSGDELPASVVHRFDGDADEWQAVEIVDELPPTVVHVFVAADTEWKSVATGDTLPTGPADGDLFNLTAAVTVPAALGAGVYKWNEGTTTWDPQAAPASGAEFPATPADGDLFGKTPADGDVVVLSTDDMVYLFGAGSWTAQAAPSAGAEFPAEPAAADLFTLTPAEDALFNLLEADGGNAAGIYKFTGGTWVDQAATIDSGVELPTTAPANPYFRVAEHKLGASATSGAGGGVAVAVSFALNIANIATTGELTSSADVMVNGGDALIGARIERLVCGRGAATRGRFRRVCWCRRIGCAEHHQRLRRSPRSAKTPKSMLPLRTACRCWPRADTPAPPSPRPGASADGLALVPSVAITISNIDRTAQILNDGDDAAVVTGDLTISVCRTTRRDRRPHHGRGCCQGGRFCSHRYCSGADHRQPQRHGHPGTRRRCRRGCDPGSLRPVG